MGTIEENRPGYSTPGVSAPSDRIPNTGDFRFVTQRRRSVLNFHLRSVMASDDEGEGQRDRGSDDGRNRVGSDNGRNHGQVIRENHDIPRAPRRPRMTFSRGTRAPPDEIEVITVRPRAKAPKPDEQALELAAARAANLPMTFLPASAMPSFQNIRDDPYVFIDKFERLSKTWPERAKVDSFAQFLEEPASSWLVVLQKDHTAELMLDEEGEQSNQWKEMEWEVLKALFLREFAEDRSREVFKRNQKDGELGMSFYYQLINLHSQANLGLDSRELAALIVSHMTPAYREKLEHKVYNDLDRLKVDIKRCDEKRSRKLAEQNKAKRQAAIAAIQVEAQAKKRKSRESECSSSEESESGDNADLRAKIMALQKQRKVDGKRKKLEAQLMALTPHISSQSSIAPGYTKPWMAGSDPSLAIPQQGFTGQQAAIGQTVQMVDWPQQSYGGYGQQTQHYSGARNSYGYRGQNNGYRGQRGGRSWRGRNWHGNRGGGRSGDRNHIMCFICHQMGHFARSCPADPRNQQRASSSTGAQAITNPNSENRARQ